jgi:hypothetical protein
MNNVFNIMHIVINKSTNASNIISATTAYEEKKKISDLGEAGTGFE